MVKILNCYLYAKKSYGTLFKGGIFFWPTLYIYINVYIYIYIYIYICYIYQKSSQSADKTAKDAGTNPSIEWSIAAKTNPYQTGAKSFSLCLAEKLVILQSNSATTLNKRSELSSKCRLKNKFKSKSFIA